MSWDVVLLIGIMFFVACYLVLDLQLWNVLMGFILFSNGANLLLLVSTKNPPGAKIPIIDDATNGIFQDPLPHAFILTAIVIGFGLTAYFISLIFLLYKEKGANTSSEQMEDM